LERALWVAALASNPKTHETKQAGDIMGALQGKVVVITGAARGLGRDYAKYFAQDGASVVLADVKLPEAAAASANEAALEGARAIGLEVDISQRASVEAMVARTKAEFGRLDILVNNAGLWRRLEEFGLLNCPDDVWDSAWDVNVKGSWLCYQAAVPLMRENDWGRIINISSITSVVGANTYGLTKAAVEHMTSGMAREVGQYGITVNCVAPGISAFEGAKSAIPAVQEVVARNPIARLGTSRDLYAAMLYLCSEGASWVTGETLRVDGGSLTR
jgi:NAD(P)-dependent dehydrogenase (short-subunit alcohol dehydrogenase family)